MAHQLGVEGGHGALLQQLPGLLGVFAADADGRAAHVLHRQRPRRSERLYHCLLTPSTKTIATHASSIRPE